MASSPLFSTPWLSRLAALLLLVGVLAVAYIWAIQPVIDAYAEADHAIEEARDLLSRFEGRGMARDALKNQAESLGRDTTSAAYYLTGQTDALAAADLQSRVQSLIESVGGHVASLQSLPGQDEQGFRRVTIRLQMRTTIGPLMQILHSLETGTPLLFVDNLDIQGRPALADDNEDAKTEPVLTVGLDVYGYLVAEAPPS